MNSFNINIKKKSIVLIASALLISPIANNITNINQENTSNQAEAASKPKYKLVKTNTFHKTIKQQNVEGAQKAIAGTIISGGGTLAGVGSVGKLVGALGFGSSIKTVLTGGNTYPLTIKERVYKKTNRTQAEKQNYYGYAIVDVYNKNTGKKVSSKTVTIGKTGV